jgi:uncharacterized protein YjgD (DUF1641 family)
MEQTTVDLNALNEKLDRLTAQVQYLAEQAQQAELARESRNELMQDAMPIAGQVMAVASEHLQEVEAYMNPQDLIRLLKKIARAAPYIEALLDQLDGVKDLLEIALPLSRDVFNSAEGVLDHAEQKGYFAFARGGARIMENIVTSFSEEDVRQLGDNIVLILRTVKEMTQPEIMTFLHNTVTGAEKDADVPVDISYRSLLGQIRDPNVRRGLGLTMRMLRTVGAQAEGVGAGARG